MKGVTRVKLISYIVYSFLAVVALVLFAIGVAWAAESNASGGITEIRSAAVEITDETRREYVMGEPLDTTGITLHIEKKGGEELVLSAEDCSFECDMNTAGKKPVLVSWQEGTILYRGSFSIKVISVRHIDIRSLDEAKRIYKTTDTALDPQGLVIWADLSEVPESGEFIQPDSRYNTVVQLKVGQFTVESNELNKPGIHSATVRCGTATASYQFAVEGLAIDTSRAATYYGVGEEFRPAGVKVSVTSEQYQTAENPLGTRYIADYQYTIPDTSTVGTKTVTVRYGAAEAVYSINVYWQAFTCYDVTPGYTVNFYWSKGPTVASEGHFKITYLDDWGVRQADINTWGHYGDNYVIWTYNGRIDNCAVRYTRNTYQWSGYEEVSLGASDHTTYGFRYLCGNGTVMEAYGTIASLRAAQAGCDAESIEISGDYAVEFDRNDRFSSEGLEVTANLWSGGTRKLDATEYTISSPDMSAAGIRTVTITYGNLTKSYQIAVRGLSVEYVNDASGYPANIYEPDTKFDASTVRIALVAGLNSVTQLSYDECAVDLPAFDVAGAYNITFSYTLSDGTVLQTSLPVYVSRPVLSFTENGSSGAKLDIFIADSRSGRTEYYRYTAPDGQVVRGARYVFRETEGRYTFELYASNTSAAMRASIGQDGRLNITVNGTSFYAEGIEWEPALLGLRVKWLEIETSGAKTYYEPGEDFSAAGLSVIAYYNDGTSERLYAGDYEITAPDLSKAGNKRVIVRYGDIRAEYTVTVGGFYADTTSVKTVFTLGEAFSYDGLKLYEYTPNGEREITDFTVSANVSEIGIHTVTITFGSNSCTYLIAVVPTVAEQNRLVFENRSGTGDKLILYVDSITGGGADTNAATASGYYLFLGENGEMAMYAFAFSYNPDGYVSTFRSELGTESISHTAGADYDYLFVEAHGVRFAAEGGSWHTAVMGWVKTLRSISIDYTNAKREYLVYGSFSTSGLVVTAYYGDGTSKRLEDWSYQVTGTPDMTVIGVKTVELSYSEGGVTVKGSYQIYAIPDVPWETNKLDFTNRSGTGATLELFIMNRTGGGSSNQNATAYGWYLVKKTDGTYIMGELTFTYTADGYASVFESEAFEESLIEDGDLQVLIDGMRFTVGAEVWHKVLMLWT